MSKCPICDKPARPRPENPSHPFCDPRCKMIDLGKWLSEEYGVPVEGQEGAEDEDKTEPDHDSPVRH